MDKNTDVFFIKDYLHKPPFSSFLPGIAGEFGIPLWAYYNNRGQGICSFGADDKDHAIMEFCPAHTAYQNNARTGFRTFLKVNGEYREAFTGCCDMEIRPSELKISWQGPKVCTEAVYFGIPGERAAMLARTLTVKNISEEACRIELLDGMPALVPYGVNNENLKMRTQLSKAWMQAKELQPGLPVFSVRASMEDIACVTKVDGGNFGFAISGSGDVLRAIIKPELIFAQDTSLSCADGFLSRTPEEILAMPQDAENEFPCCFFASSGTLQPGEEMQVFSVFGQCGKKEEIPGFVKKISGPGWYHVKRQEACNLVLQLTDKIETHTANETFDAYCRQTYLDNLLRGGVPVFFGQGEERTPFYLYSRKHGDPEREYNAFSLGKEYYAQGNGNFRDVCQNRRCDVLFYPEIKDYNIRMFFELIQSDGYNPLVLKRSTFRLSPETAKECMLWFPTARQAEAEKMLCRDFTPGEAAMFAEESGLDESRIHDFLSRILSSAECSPNADFQEGYWCDHWTYLSDLIEKYLAVYPEQKKGLLFGGRNLRWYETHAFVNPRQKRYTETENGRRQYHSLDLVCKAKTENRWLQTESGETARSSLTEKLIFLCVIKSATVDAGGMGMEMEGGKPGWYDALNGLPGLLGSSVAETCELVRMLRFMENLLGEQEGEISLYTEMADLLDETACAYAAYSSASERWNALNEAKEKYRERTMYALTGERRALDCAGILKVFRNIRETLEKGIAEAVRRGDGICPTYFTYEEDSQPKMLPLFLEGPVHWLKLSAPLDEKRKMAEKVKASGLYDRELQMYKVNESLAGVSYEAGRALAFTPGWLENESIWLHMEYKYLLELLRSGLYPEFRDSFIKVAVPFMDPKVYGRSTYENVSFIASSANADKRVHGRGFVARLSGSTAEFLEIWNLMFFGPEPFSCGSEGKLKMKLQPCIPSYLVPSDKKVSAVFLGRTKVTYELEGLEEAVPGRYQTASYELEDGTGLRSVYETEELPAEPALQVREGKIKAIKAVLKKI